MKREFFCFGCFILCGLAVCVADTNSVDTTVAAPTNKEKFLIHTGGFIPNKRDCKGSIAFVDAQKIVDGDFVKDRIKKIEDQLWFKTEYFKASGDVSLGRVGSLAKGKGSVEVVLVDNVDYPALVGLPEEKCVVINVSALSKDGASAEIVKTRVAKEMARGCAYTLGICHGENEGGVLDPVSSLADLDSIVADILPGEVALNADHAAARYGITRFRRTTYLKACQEGWAPSPKGKYQQKIWDEVHELPTEPIVIKAPSK